MIMSDVTVFGFQRSTYVNVVRMVLTEKVVPFRFHDTEDEMYTPEHLARHPFGRAPVLQHGDFMLYETSAIVAYVDEVLDGPKLTPDEPRKRARMNQWISNVNGYIYPYMIYHISHERNIFPELGIEPKQAIIDRAMPIAIRALEVMDRELGDGRPFFVGEQLTLADFFLLPMLTAFGFAPEAKELKPRYKHLVAWENRMNALPSVVRFRASVPPRGPIPHARRWAEHHRPLG
jgi:glutathione S-transferase